VVVKVLDCVGAHYEVQDVQRVLESTSGAPLPSRSNVSAERD